MVPFVGAFLAEDFLIIDSVWVLLVGFRLVLRDLVVLAESISYILLIWVSDDSFCAGWPPLPCSLFIRSWKACGSNWPDLETDLLTMELPVTDWRN